MHFDQKKITDLVNENYACASVLHYFGIEFYQYTDETLIQVCRSKGLSTEMVVAELETAVKEPNEENLSLISYPVGLVVAYLKHSHLLFVKRRLPFMADLISHLSDNHEGYQRVIKDLKFVFPLFVEDFIYHIHKEEDELFSYIKLLESTTEGTYNPSILYYKMEKYSIHQQAVEHDLHDDEMKGIRNITKDYKLKSTATLPVKVAYAELQAFEAELITHARIENEILFPKALALEKEVKTLLQQKAKWN
ncbi:MAG: hemerythrin domain-containing protein [Cyclobacteriaceae bacterium]